MTNLDMSDNERMGVAHCELLDVHSMLTFLENALRELADDRELNAQRSEEVHGMAATAKMITRLVREISALIEPGPES